MIKWSLSGRGVAALLVLAAGLPASAAGAQQTQPQNQAPGAGTPIGPPQLRDFDLAPRNRPTQPRQIPTQPVQQAEQPAQPAQRPVERTAPTQQAQRPAPTREPGAVARQPAQPDTPAPTELRAPRPDTSAPSAPPSSIPAPTTDTVTMPTTSDPVSQTPAPATAPASAPTDEPGGLPLWLFLLGGLGLGLVGYMLLKRRRAAARRELLADAETVPAVAVAPAAPRVPRPDPVPRPWLEVELIPERTTADPAESIVEFEMVIRNNGGSTARDVRLQAKLICSTPDQDKEIAAFHRKKPGEHRTLQIPDIAAGQELRLKGQVDIKREDIKALRMDQRLIWVPLVAVNAFYAWGTARTGQTSKSFLVGREQPETKDKMAPFRLDLGPRVYRTVGQRPYKIERRV